MREDLLSYRIIHGKKEFTNGVVKPSGELTLDDVKLFAKNMIETFEELINA